MPRRNSGPRDSAPSERRHSDKRDQGKGRSPSRPPRSSGEEREELARIVVTAVAGPDQERLLSLLTKYLDEIRVWNARGNLVSSGDLGRLVRRHVLESMAVLPILDEIRPASMIDIGAGGGFPAIPLKLARPDLALAMVESRRMKALFLSRATLALALESTWVWATRAETLSALSDPSDSLAEVVASARGDGAPRLRPQVDLVTARAVAPLSTLAEWAGPLVKPGGHLLTFKGSKLEGEIADWHRAPGPWEAAGVVAVGPGIQAVLLRRTDVSRETAGRA